MGNENALRLLNWCEEVKKPIWIRHVCVPGLTFQTDKLQKLADFLSPFSCIEKVELLPFHKMGAYKWDALKIPFTLADIPEPTAAEMEKAHAIFRKAGLPI